MVKTGSFDLLGRRKPGWKPEAALIVSPYVEKGFFARIARNLRPKSIHIVIDVDRRESIIPLGDLNSSPLQQFTT